MYLNCLEISGQSERLMNYWMPFVFFIVEILIYNKKDISILSFGMRLYFGSKICVFDSRVGNFYIKRGSIDLFFSNFTLGRYWEMLTDVWFWKVFSEQLLFYLAGILLRICSSQMQQIYSLRSSCSRPMICGMKFRFIILIKLLNWFLLCITPLFHFCGTIISETEKTLKISRSSKQIHQKLIQFHSLYIQKYIILFVLQ